MIEVKKFIGDHRSVGIVSDKAQHMVHGARVCKESFVGRVRSQVFALVEEEFHVWLLSLKAVYVDTLFLVEWQSVEEYDQKVRMQVGARGADNLFALLGWRKLKVIELHKLSSNTILLVSASLS